MYALLVKYRQGSLLTGTKMTRTTRNNPLPKSPPAGTSTTVGLTARKRKISAYARRAPGKKSEAKRQRFGLTAQAVHSQVFFPQLKKSHLGGDGVYQTFSWSDPRPKEPAGFPLPIPGTPDPSALRKKLVRCISLDTNAVDVLARHERIPPAFPFPLAAASGPLLAAARASGSGLQNSSTRRLYEPIEEVQAPPLRLGPLLGRGGFGNAHLLNGCVLKMKAGKQCDGVQLQDENDLMHQAGLGNSGIPAAKGIVSVEGGGAGILMERVRGPSLEEVLSSIRHTDKLSFEERSTAGIFLAKQLAQSIYEMHQNGIVHGDIKGANLMVDAEAVARGSGRVVKIIDFGLAEVVGYGHAGASLFYVNVGGSPPYLAPEVLDGRRGFNSDAFSFGVILKTIKFDPEDCLKALLPEADFDDPVFPYQFNYFAANKYLEAKNRCKDGGCRESSFFKSDGTDMGDIVEAMTRVLPEERMSIGEFLQHPMIENLDGGRGWSALRRAFIPEIATLDGLNGLLQEVLSSIGAGWAANGDDITEVMQISKTIQAATVAMMNERCPMKAAVFQESLRKMEEFAKGFDFFKIFAAKQFLVQASETLK